MNYEDHYNSVVRRTFEYGSTGLSGSVLRNYARENYG
jgi:hypothetical protein